MTKERLITNTLSVRNT